MLKKLLARIRPYVRKVPEPIEFSGRVEIPEEKIIPVLLGIEGTRITGGWTWTIADHLIEMAVENGSPIALYINGKELPNCGKTRNLALEQLRTILRRRAQTLASATGYRLVPVDESNSAPRLFGVEGLPTGGGNWKWSFGPWEVATVGDRFSVRTEISHVCLKKSLGEAEAHILNELLRHANAIGYGIVSK